MNSLKSHPFDERRNLLIPGDQIATLQLCLTHFISVCQASIREHGQFFVALAGGSTPKALYQHLCSPPYAEKIDWGKVWLFWGDERSVPPDHAESNYKMAMDAGFAKMPIPPNQILRMEGEKDIEENAKKYEANLRKILSGRPLDLVILGMGEDGHTASLFPQTAGLKENKRLVIANYVPQKNTWRMTLTFLAINSAKNIAIYVMGAEKKHTLAKVFQSKDQFELYPIQNVGTKENKALWILDEAAASELINSKRAAEK